VPVGSRAARHRIFRSAEPLLVFSLKNNNNRRGQLRRVGTRGSRLGFCHPERSEGSTRSDSPIVSRFKQASALARLLASLREDSSASLGMTERAARIDSLLLRFMRRDTIR
jgi:hypothetical protein